MDPNETGCEGTKWIHRAWNKDPVAGSCKHSNEHDECSLLDYGIARRLKSTYSLL
jgi:hypothetical protein